MTTCRVHIGSRYHDFSTLAEARAFCAESSATNRDRWHKLGCEETQTVEYWINGAVREWSL